MIDEASRYSQEVPVLLAGRRPKANVRAWRSLGYDRALRRVAAGRGPVGNCAE